MDLPDTKLLVPAVLHEVIDGDTVELFVSGQIVRYELSGADAPDDVVVEGHRPLRGSQEAKDFLKLLVEGEQLAVFPDAYKPLDAMGRARAFVYRMPDGLLVNLELVRLGFAKHAREPMGFNNAAMMWAQDRARDAQKGLWSPVPRKVPEQNHPQQSEEPDPDPEQTVPEVTATKQQVSAQDSLVVYITKYGTKYHTKDCQHISESMITKKRDDVQETHQPCKSCDPDKLSSD